MTSAPIRRTFLGQVPIDVRLDVADDPGAIDARADGADRQLVTTVEAGGVRIPPGEIGMLEVTPRSDGSRALKVQIHLVDPGGDIIDSAEVALPEQDVAGEDTVTEWSRRLAWIFGGLVAAVGFLAALVGLVAGTKKLFG